MERTVPSTASEEIELYLRTVYSLLRTSADVQIRTLEEVPAGMNPLMHPEVRKQAPDTSAFIYSLLRLPDCLSQVKTVVLGQSQSVFGQAGYDLRTWQPVAARARRRRCFFNKTDTLACFIASRSDIDDVIPCLTAYQIEWNKLNSLLNRAGRDLLTLTTLKDRALFGELAKVLELSIDDLDRLRKWRQQEVWGNAYRRPRLYHALVDERVEPPFVRKDATR